ncbi:unnamed protein product [Phaedon cochleariae]|uniref:Uncharacterized protein n=1 Tax=Phaedon cochleariae TaxID=80249 RepID=A0A9P0DLS9_PHACE|nr:unnamed protein product [Phaedon cochleariae]
MSGSGYGFRPPGFYVPGQQGNGEYPQYPHNSTPNHYYPQLPQVPQYQPPSYSPPQYMPPQHAAPVISPTSYQWIDTTAYGGVPPTAFRGGVDIDGHPIYVGRAFHAGDWIPAKVIPGKHVAYICHNGREHAKDRFQVLCEQHFHWLPDYGGRVPYGAVEGGRTSSGEPLYIGRVHHQGSHTVGKIHPSHGVCYIPFDGKEVSYRNYEVLLRR